jgi:membrane-bound lytic murein transglycosylase B
MGRLADGSRGLLLVAVILSWATPGTAASCGGNFDAWPQNFTQEAAAQGVSQRTITTVLVGLAPDPRVLSLDRNQHATFHKSFEQFASTRVTDFAINKGRSLMARYSAALTRIEQQYGVPRQVVVAIWGLESGFGAVTGMLPTIRSLATLAHDCRRSELIAAPKIIDRGDLFARRNAGGLGGRARSNSVSALVLPQICR